MTKTELSKIYLIILLIGGINWGLIGFFGIDLIALIFGGMSIVTRSLYAIVGLSAVATVVMEMRS